MPASIKCDTRRAVYGAQELVVQLELAACGTVTGDLWIQTMDIIENTAFILIWPTIPLFYTKKEVLQKKFSWDINTHILSR